MDKYPKIHTLFVRDKKKKVIEGQWNPEMPFEYLKDNLWWMDEKVDGMNIRIHWDTKWFYIEGRNDNASIPSYLGNYLHRKLESNRILWERNYTNPITIYGEGFGHGIQGKMGIEYAKESCPDVEGCQVGFRIFDVMVDTWWLERPNVEDVARTIGFDTVPSFGYGTFDEAIAMCKDGFVSQIGDITAEGLILRPMVDLFTRKGERIIGKLKHKDFAK